MGTSIPPLLTTQRHEKMRSLFLIGILPFIACVHFTAPPRSQAAPYFQDPPRYQDAPSFQAPLSYQAAPSFQHPPRYQDGPSFHDPPRYHDAPSFQPPSRYQAVPSFHAPPRYQGNPSFQAPPRYQGNPSFQGEVCYDVGGRRGSKNCQRMESRWNVCNPRSRKYAKYSKTCRKTCGLCHTPSFNAPQGYQTAPSFQAPLNFRGHPSLQGPPSLGGHSSLQDSPSLEGPVQESNQLCKDDPEMKCQGWKKWTNICSPDHKDHLKFATKCKKTCELC